MNTPEVVYMIVNEDGEMWTNRVYTTLSVAKMRRTRLERDWESHGLIFNIKQSYVSWEAAEG